MIRGTADQAVQPQRRLSVSASTSDRAGASYAPDHRRASRTSGETGDDNDDESNPRGEKRAQGDHDGLRTGSIDGCSSDESIGGGQLSPMVKPGVHALESRSSALLRRVRVRRRQAKRSTQEGLAGRDQPGGASDRKAADRHAPPGQHRPRTGTGTGTTTIYAKQAFSGRARGRL